MQVELLKVLKSVFKPVGKWDTVLAILFATPAIAQNTLFSDDFAANTSSTYTSTGSIGTSLWSVARSGNDYGARRHNNRLELSNDISTTNNGNGWVYASLPVAEMTCYALALNNNTSPLTWTFNMRQSQADPGGFSNNTYGVGFVLAGTDASAGTAGTGYAIVLGQSGSTDPLRLVHYNNGLRGTLTNIITSNTSGLTDFGTQYLSIKVTYDPSTDTWQLWLRNDGTSAFANPASGTLVSQGTATNSTYTGSGIVTMGTYWQGGNAAGQAALFDNVSFSKTSTAPTVDTITQPTCSNNTGSVTLTGLPTTGNWLLTQNPGGTVTAGTGGSTTISGLAPNTYTYTVSEYHYGYQKTVTGCGTTATIFIEPTNIVPLDDPCTNGYNYNVQFNYTITISGVNTCYNGEFGFQPQIFCNSQNNGNYTIRVPAPTVGAAATTTVYRGTLTTQTRPWNPNTDCETANIVNQNCNRVDVTIWGPGVGTETFPTTVTTSSSCPSPVSGNVVITAAAAPSITAQPSGISVCGNTTSNFSVAASGSGSTYEWQRKTAGSSSGNWTAIGTTGGASGAGTANLSIANPESNGWNGYVVRAVIDQGGCTVTSDSALITISTAPTAPTAITSTSNVATTALGQTYVACIGSSIVLTATGGSNGSGSYYQWGTGNTVGSNVIAGNSASITITAMGGNKYWVARVGNTGCTNTTTAATANAEVRQPSTTISVNGNAIANGDYLWTGNSSLLWSTSANWLRFDGTNYNLVSTLPDNNTNIFVVHPTDAVQCVANNSVTINGDNYGTRNVNIGLNAQMWLAGNYKLNVTGNWINLGTFTASNGTVVFNGTGTQTVLTGLGSGTSNSAKEFKHLTINKTNGSTISLLDNLSASGKLTLTTGELYIPLNVVAKSEEIHIDTEGKLRIAGQLKLND